MVLLTRRPGSTYLRRLGDEPLGFVVPGYDPQDPEGAVDNRISQRHAASALIDPVSATSASVTFKTGSPGTSDAVCPSGPSPR
jgi:hypothetical protein